MRCSPGTRRVLQRRSPRAQKRTRPPALRLLSGLSNALRLYAFGACTAPTPVPTGTPAPTNVGDTNPPTRAPTFAPTRGPNFADPTGEGDAIGATFLPSLPPFPPFLLPPPPVPLTALHSVRPSPRRVTALHAPEALWHYVWHAAATAVPKGSARCSGTQGSSGVLTRGRAAVWRGLVRGC